MTVGKGMKWMYCMALCLSTVGFVHLVAQPLEEIEQELAFYADVLVNADRAAHRVSANEHFHPRFVELMARPEARDYPFSSLTWVTQVTPADSSFRIFSWQLKLSEEQYRYHAVIVPFDPDRPVIELHDKRSLRSEFGRHDPQTWYGALYYGIQPFVLEDGKVAYMVLGFNAKDARTNQKVA
ncbi:MAG: hypothetical protein R3301_04605, partial [Saprospiraceae bacterium]|nr:hypothetical protein [Saprospiraceae bacterium]